MNRDTSFLPGHTDMIRLLLAAIDIYMLILLVRVIFSYLPPHTRQNQIYDFIYKITEPLLRPLRDLIPTTHGIDFSPLAAFFLLYLLRWILLGM
jgi:YggT family protein